MSRDVTRALHNVIHNIEPQTQWIRAVEALRKMNDLDKAQAWIEISNSTVHTSPEITGNLVLLSQYTILFNRALNDAECSISNLNMPSCTCHQQFGFLIHEQIEKLEFLVKELGIVHNVSRIVFPDVGENVQEMDLEGDGSTQPQAHRMSGKKNFHGSAKIADSSALTTGIQALSQQITATTAKTLDTVVAIERSHTVILGQLEQTNRKLIEQRAEQEALNAKIGEAVERSCAEVLKRVAETSTKQDAVCAEVLKRVAETSTKQEAVCAEVLKRSEEAIERSCAKYDALEAQLHAIRDNLDEKHRQRSELREEFTTLHTRLTSVLDDTTRALRAELDTVKAIQEEITAMKQENKAHVELLNQNYRKVLQENIDLKEIVTREFMPETERRLAELEGRPSLPTRPPPPMRPEPPTPPAATTPAGRPQPTSPPPARPAPPTAPISPPARPEPPTPPAAAASARQSLVDETPISKQAARNRFEHGSSTAISENGTRRTRAQRLNRPVRESESPLVASQRPGRGNTVSDIVAQKEAKHGGRTVWSPSDASPPASPAAHHEPRQARPEPVSQGRWADPAGPKPPEAWRTAELRPHDSRQPDEPKKPLRPTSAATLPSASASGP